MKSESPTSPAIPPPNTEHQPLPQIPVNSVPICPIPPFLPPDMMQVFMRCNGYLVNEFEEPSYFNYLDGKENADKYRSYESEFKRTLFPKYFSGKNPQGVNIFEEMTTRDGDTIKSTRWPCTRSYAYPEISYADPVQCLEEVEDDDEEEEEEEESVDSASEEISPGEISNGGTV